MREITQIKVKRKARSFAARLRLAFRSHRRAALFFGLCVGFFNLLTSFVFSQSIIPSTNAVSTTKNFRHDQILVMPKDSVSAKALSAFHAVRQAAVVNTFEGIRGLQIVRVPKGESVEHLVASYEKSGLVEFAEPDYAIHAALSPNDPQFLNGTLWGLNNTGQDGGTADADIDAPEAWDVLNSASNIVVAVLDTGVRFTHEDLAANIWVNPNDGGHGFNAFTGTNDVADDQGHGTLVSGVLGAVGNNGKGVTGVAWRVQMMAGKCLDNSGNGSDSTLIACIEYARTNGAKIINASLDSPSFSMAVSNAILAARNAGIIFVASSGNNGTNIDINPRYPACYGIDNIVSVAASTRSDTVWSLSNYGATNVDIFAPGEQIQTTWIPNDSFYTSLFSGTSFSAPYVSGAFALLVAKYPAETHQQIISRLLNAADPVPAFAGKCVTGGRLNLHNALSPVISLALIPTAANQPFQLRLSGGPNRLCVIESTTNLTSWLPVYTNTTTANGTFDFADNGSTNSSRRFFRAVSAP